MEVDIPEPDVHLLIEKMAESDDVRMVFRECGPQSDQADKDQESDEVLVPPYVITYTRHHLIAKKAEGADLLLPQGILVRVPNHLILLWAPGAPADFDLIQWVQDRLQELMSPPQQLFTAMDVLRGELDAASDRVAVREAAAQQEAEQFVRFRGIVPVMLNGWIHQITAIRKLTEI